LAELKKGLTLQTGRRYKVVIVADLVEVHVEWPAHVVERLPDDFALTLSGPDLPPQKLTKDAAASVDGDMMRFQFRWRDKSQVVMLEATGNGQKVALWRGHVSADLGVAVDWDQRLDSLLTPHGDVEIAGQDSGATEVPADLRAHELAALVASLLS
jgi:hypothetical protein